MSIRKWTKQKLFDEAQKFETRNEFQKQSTNAYSAAYKRGLLNEICSHMKNGYIKWTKENVIELALKYDCISSFRKNETNAYDVASKRLKIIPEIRFLIGIKKKENKIWTKEACIIEANKYITRKEFSHNNQSAYKASIKCGWLDDICKHMIKLKNNWTKEQIYNEALKYNTYIDFIYNGNKFYQYALKNKWLDDVCSHMIRPNNYQIPRIIYAYIFEDKSIYIGLTKNFKVRHNFRKRYKKDTVTKFIKETGLQPKIKFLTEFIPAEEAQKLEQFYIDKYKSEGWNILNKAKGGSLGGPGIKLIPLEL